MMRERSAVREARDAGKEYRRLLARLASRARWLGSRDPESAGQEALKRSLENPSSHAAIEYFFAEELPPDAVSPEWSLHQLLPWLHGVVHYVVREEQNRSGNRREVLTGGMASERPEQKVSLDPPDPRPSQLETLLEQEMQQIVVHCLPTLDREYREVLRLRARGMKYGEIARRLGVNENTVATWIARGIKTLAQCVRRRAERPSPLVRIGEEK